MKPPKVYGEPGGYRRRMMVPRLFAAICLLALLAAAFPLPTGSAEVSSAPARVDYGRVKAGFKGDIPLDITDWAILRGGAVVLRSEELRFVAIQLNDNVDPFWFRDQVRARADVEWATFDGFVRATGASGDPRTTEYALDLVHARPAWTLTPGDPSVILAVLDTGVDASHEDLQKACFPLCTQMTHDVNGHGSHVAGIAAAETGNGKGIAGMAQVRVLPVKVLDDNGNGRWSDLAVGIVQAANAGADVVSMSLGGSCGRDPVCPEIQRAVDYAWALDVVLVAAAGNNGLDGYVDQPAAMARVVAVGSVGPTKARSSFSNGGDALDIVAPGEAIVSSVPSISTKCGLTNGYCPLSGTSQATPFVAAAAALMRSRCGSLQNAEIVDKLLAKAEDLGAAGFDPAYGHGLLNAEASLLAVGAC